MQNPLQNPVQDPVLMQMLQAPQGMQSPQLAPSTQTAPPNTVNLDQIMMGNAQAPGMGAPSSMTPTVPTPGQIVSPLDTGSRQDWGNPPAQIGTGDPFLDQVMGMPDVLPLYPNKDAARNKTPKPSKSFIKTVIEMDPVLYQDTLETMSLNLSMYRQHTSGKPIGLHPTREKAVHMADISNLVNKLANMFSGTKVIAEAPYDTTDEEKASQRVENAYYYIRKKMKQEYARQTGGNLQRDEYFYLLLHGRYVYRTLPDVSDPEFPYNIALIDPATCFPTYSSGKNGMLRMVRKYRSTVGSVVTAYSDVDPDLQMKLATKLGYQNYTDYATYMNDEHDVVEYWDRWWRYVEFAGQEVLPVTAHEYGFVPFTYVMAVGEPWGMQTPNGGYIGDYKDPDSFLNGPYIRNSRSDLAEKGVSVFHYLRSTHRLKEALNTILYNEVEKMSSPPTITYTAPHLLNKEFPPFDMKRGGSNIRAMGMHDVQAIPTSPRPTDISPLLNNLTESWVEGTVPPSFYGASPGANVSGIALDSVLASAKDLALPYMEAWCNGQSQMFEQCLHHYQSRIAPIITMVFPATKGGKNELMALSPQDIDATGCALQMRVTGIDDANEGARIAFVNQAIQAGLYSQRYGMEKLDIENPDRMFQDILAEKAMQHDLMMQDVLIPSALAARGDEDLLDIWLQLVVAPSIAQMQASGAAGGVSGAPSPVGGNGGAAQQMGGAGGQS